MWQRKIDFTGELGVPAAFQALDVIPQHLPLCQKGG